MKMNFEKLSEELRANGIVYIPGFISPSVAAEIKNDIEKAVQKDIDERQAAQQNFGRFDGSAGISHNNQGKHIITDFFGRSPKLDESVGKKFFR